MIPERKPPSGLKIDILTELWNTQDDYEQIAERCGCKDSYVRGLASVHKMRRHKTAERRRRPGTLVRGISDHVTRYL